MVAGEQMTAGILLAFVMYIDRFFNPIRDLANRYNTLQATMAAGELAKIQTRPINSGDHICTKEDVYYSPLTKLDHAMPAVASAHNFRGAGLGANWSTPDKRSAFVGTFQYQE